MGSGVPVNLFSAALRKGRIIGYRREGLFCFLATLLINTVYTFPQFVHVSLSYIYTCILIRVDSYIHENTKSSMEFIW